MATKLCPFRRAVPYGCGTKPVTTETLTNVAIWGDTHDVTYSYKRFEGLGAWSVATVTMVVRADNSAAPPTGNPITNITFDHCVFGTPPSGYNANTFYAQNLSTIGSVISGITFDHCWFEPAPRMQLEINGRGGWWHDVTLNHCTFEPSVSQHLSFDMSPDSSDPSYPFGVTVSGTVRGVENLTVQYCDFQGTGATVNGYEPGSYKMAAEFRDVYAYTVDGTGGSKVIGNRFGRGASAWLNIGSDVNEGIIYTRDMLFQNNLFDWTYNPGSITYTNHDAPWSNKIADSIFRGNTYVLGTDTNEPYEFVGATGYGCTFENEHWTKSAGTIGSTCAMYFTDSVFNGCHFHLPKNVHFSPDASGVDTCTFDNGYTIDEA